MAPRPITASDYAAMALNVPGVVVGRAVALDGYVPAGQTVDATTGPYPEPWIPNTGIGRVMTVYVTQPDSTAFTDGDETVSGSAKNLIRSYLQNLREANFVIFVLDPTYVPVAVTIPGIGDSDTVGLHLIDDPSVVPTVVQAAVEAAIASFLDPSAWGQPNAGRGDLAVWNNTQIVRYNALLRAIEDVAGVSYCSSLEIAGGAIGANYTLSSPGNPVVLPTAGTITVPVPTVGS